MSYIIDIQENMEDTGYEQYIEIDNDEENGAREKNRKMQKKLDDYETMMEYGLINQSDYKKPLYILSPLYIIVQIVAYWFLK